MGLYKENFMFDNYEAEVWNHYEFEENWLLEEVLK